MKFLTAIALLLVLTTRPALAGDEFQKDVIKTTAGDLAITFIGHGTLMLEFQDKTIHIDPHEAYADYSKLPKADLILLTHHHHDHLDPEAIKQIRTASTIVILTETCAKTVKGGMIMRNDEIRQVLDMIVESVPAYNLVHMQKDGTPWHPKGVGNGYVLNLGNKRVYVAGDTEKTPEMKIMGNIDIAFLPMNLPYTMTPEMVAAAVAVIKPGILYPYHYGDTDLAQLRKLLKNSPTKLRIRAMQ